MQAAYGPSALFNLLKYGLNICSRRVGGIENNLCGLDGKREAFAFYNHAHSYVHNYAHIHIPKYWSTNAAAQLLNTTTAYSYTFNNTN